MFCNTKNLVVALDIGTSKVVTIIAKIQPNQQVEILGIGHTVSQGIRKGSVVNMETTINSVQIALEEAKPSENFKIRKVYAGISGNHIQSMNSSGMVAIKGKEVTVLDICRVTEIAKTVRIPTDQKVLHVLTQEFIIDGQDGIYDPVGMCGLRLESNVHIITASKREVKNLQRCLHGCNLEMQNLILQPLASSLAVLTEHEKDLGVVLVDIGGGTTDIAIFVGGVVRHISILPIAGNQITNDIAAILRIPKSDAEEIKLRYGVTKKVLINNASASIELSDNKHFGVNSIKHEMLVDILESRVEELFLQIKSVIQTSGCEDLIYSGLVLTGGSSLIPGIIELAKDIFLKPVRIGVPRCEGIFDEKIIKDPRFSTVIGLLKEGGIDHAQDYKSKIKSRMYGSKFFRIKKWFTS